MSKHIEQGGRKIQDLRSGPPEEVLDKKVSSTWTIYSLPGSMSPIDLEAVRSFYRYAEEMPSRTNKGRQGSSFSSFHVKISSSRFLHGLAIFLFVKIPVPASCYFEIASRLTPVLLITHSPINIFQGGGLLASLHDVFSTLWSLVHMMQRPLCCSRARTRSELLTLI